MDDREVTQERLEVQRTIAADAPTIFRVVCDPKGQRRDRQLGQVAVSHREPVNGTTDGGTLVTSYDDRSNIDPVWREARESRLRAAPLRRQLEARQRLSKGRRQVRGAMRSRMASGPHVPGS